MWGREFVSQGDGLNSHAGILARHGSVSVMVCVRNVLLREIEFPGLVFASLHARQRVEILVDTFAGEPSQIA